MPLCFPAEDPAGDPVSPPKGLNFFPEKRKLTMKEKKRRTVKIPDIPLSVPSETDPLGMYTGVPADRGEKPVQDADDL